MNIVQKPSPNFFSGRKGQKPIAVVLHIMAGSLSGTDSWFSYPKSQVSSHYGIGLNGEIHQYVQEENGAWANGIINKPSWKLLNLLVNPNLYTISIEHEGQDLSSAPAAQKEASAALVRDICTRYSLPIDRDHVIGHYQLDSVKKPNCPAVNKSIIDEIVALAGGVDKLSTRVTKIASDLVVISPEHSKRLTDIAKEMVLAGV